MAEAKAQEFRYENGRRYHAHHEGAYLLPNDDDEASRLDTQHDIWLQTLPNRALHIAPIAPDIPTVLDIGTGTGVWAIDFARRHPNTRVLGTDLSAIHPTALPPNCNFMIADAEQQPWEDVFRGQRFDFIHSRMLCMGMHDWERYFGNCFRHLETGGWVEAQEVHLTWHSAASPPSSPTSAPFLRLGRLLTDVVREAGIDVRASSDFRAMLERVGFVEVREVLTRWPVGDWSDDEGEKRIGRMERKNLEDGLHGIGVGALTKHGGFTIGEAERLVDEARRDLVEGQAEKRYYETM